MNHVDCRIAIFISSLEGGGAQRSMLNLAGGLAEAGYRVDLLVARAQGPYLNQIPSSVRLIDLGRGRALRSLVPLMRYMRTESPAVMLSSLTYINIVAILAKKLSRAPLRLVVNEQNTLSRSAKYSRKGRNRITPWLAKWLYPSADGIVAVSEGVKQDLAQTIRLPRERVDVVFNPSVTRDHVLLEAAKPVSHPWFQAGEPPVVLAVGRLHQQKDYPTLLRAFAEVVERQPARLMILGEGEKREELEGLVQELRLTGQVALPGFVDNPFAYMSRAALYVLSSRWEGLPTVLVEALCCGTPVVATDCPSGPREILRERRFGQLVPVGDVAALADAMKTALEHAGDPPPQESWAPFELNAVVVDYLNVLIGAR